MFDIFKSKNELMNKYVEVAIGLNNKYPESKIIKLIRNKGIDYFRSAYDKIYYPNTLDFKNMGKWKDFVYSTTNKFYSEISNEYKLSNKLIVDPFDGYMTFVTSLCNSGSFLARYANEGISEGSYTIGFNEKAPNNYKKSYLYNIILHEITHIICDEFKYSETKFDEILNILIKEYKDKGYNIEDINYNRSHRFSFLNFSARLKSTLVNIPNKDISSEEFIYRMKNFKFLQL